MLIALQLFCAFLLGIGFIFTLIEFRSRFGPLFRNFSVCLLVFPSAALMDLFSYVETVPVGTKLLLQQGMHLLMLPFIPFSIAHILKIANRPAAKAPWIFSALSALLFPIALTDGFLRVHDGEVGGGPLYAWTFLPYGTLYILFAYHAMIGHLRSVPRRDRKFPALHLLGFAFATVGGFLDMLAVVNPRWQIFSSCKSIGIMVFGVFCAYFFASQFLILLRERDELFRKVEGLNRDLSRMMPIRKMGESAAFISHEIKNYVSVLKSNHLLLKRRLDGAGNLDEMERMGRSTEKLDSFVRAILDYANSADSLRMERISLGQVIQECRSLHFPDQRDIIYVTLQENLPQILGERGRLERALLNLIKNSLEAGAARIRIAVTAGAGVVSMDLEDDGEGCEDGALAQVGSPFFTTKKKSGGTGLGIAITASIMESHGGTLSLLPDVPGRLGKGGFLVRLAFPAANPAPENIGLRA